MELNLNDEPPPSLFFGWVPSTKATTHRWARSSSSSAGKTNRRESLVAGTGVGTEEKIWFFGKHMRRPRRGVVTDDGKYKTSPSCFRVGNKRRIKTAKHHEASSWFVQRARWMEPPSCRPLPPPAPGVDEPDTIDLFFPSRTMHKN